MSIDMTSALAQDNMRTSSPLIDYSESSIRITPMPNGSWQDEMRSAVRNVGDLLARLRISPDQLQHKVDSAAHDFPLRVTKSFIDRMVPGDPTDPLLLQVLPLLDESVQNPMSPSAIDPVGDILAQRLPGLIHKYYGRVLVIATGACATHCRYCFRRHFDYLDSHAKHAYDSALLGYLASHTEVHELILSGGDPLTLSDERIEAWVQAASSIPTLTTLRIHTRLPVLLPSRVTDRLLETLSSTRLRVVIVVHTNHANELDDEVLTALGRLDRARVTLLNQTVLLRGINDTADCLVRLSARLWEARVLPYYIHTLDRVQGAAHFEVDESTARSLHENMKRLLPGYLVPRFVHEDPGGASKRWL